MNGNTELGDNMFGLEKFVEQADQLTMAILIILVLMSLASWFVILTKLWDQTRIAKAYEEAHNYPAGNRSLGERPWECAGQVAERVGLPSPN